MKDWNAWKDTDNSFQLSAVEKIIKYGKISPYCSFKNNIFRGSSVVERPAVNRLAVGSNPTRGANFLIFSITIPRYFSGFCFVILIMSTSQEQGMT